MFSKIFSQKRKVFRFKRSPSVKNFALEGKIVISYCGEHDTINLFFSFRGYQEKFIRWNYEIFKNPCLEKLITKCQKYRYEEPVDFDLMEKCQEGELLQSCDKNSKFCCDCQKQYECSRYEQLKKADLSPYCLIATFLQSCNRSSYLLCDCSGWECFSEEKTLCEPCLFDKDMYTFSDDFLKLNKSSRISKIFHNFVLFYRIQNYWNSVNKRVVDDYFELFDAEKHYLFKHF